MSSNNLRVFCNLGWSGFQCNTDLNECHLKADICNSGTCTNTPGSYHCTCPFGTYGKECDIAETCDSHLCKNGATCLTDSKHIISCKCLAGYSGKSCEVVSHSATTTSHATSTIKHSTTKQCPKNCSGRGRCSHGNCLCRGSWTGIDCSKVDHCSINPCKNKGKCNNNATGHTCNCTTQWTGNNCDIHNYCSVSPCVHGHCTNGRTALSCSCSNGWTGTTCNQ
ncbi:protein serrate-like [Mytilus galloprovincialis]|uniref:protein serrate-like n=1 Tax=Mytilus galloprovincialis TaxID=29158 RepID=UPI003F7C5805